MIGLTFKLHRPDKVDMIRWPYITIKDRTLSHTIEGEEQATPDPADGTVPASYYYYTLGCVCVDADNHVHFDRIEEDVLLKDIRERVYILDFDDD